MVRVMADLPRMVQLAVAADLVAAERAVEMELVVDQQVIVVVAAVVGVATAAAAAAAPVGVAE